MPDFSAHRRMMPVRPATAAAVRAEKPAKPKVSPSIRHRLRAEVLAEKR